jgi:hypothetical protein
MLDDAQDAAAQRRTANFFRGTMRDPAHRAEPKSANEPLEAIALPVIRCHLEAHAQSLGRTLGGADLDRMLAAAQSYLRSLPRDQLQGFSASSALMKTITDASFAAAPAPDARTAAALAATQAQGAPNDPSNVIAGRFREGLERGASVGSGARFAGMSGDRTSPELAVMMQAAASEAVRLGIPWAAAKPELLRLGTAAVRAIADVNLKEQSYQRLRTDGRFEVKDVVTFATYAKSKGIKDANQAAGAVADFVQLGQNQAEQQRLKDAVVGFMKASNEAGVAPHDPTAQQRLQQAGVTYREAARDVARRSPEAADTTRRLEDATRVPQEFRATAATIEVKNDVKVVKADAKDDLAARRGTDDDAALARLSVPEKTSEVTAPPQPVADKKAAPTAAQPAAKPAVPK